jgi:hypothetical protein
MITGWQGLATRDEATIADWWRQWPNANIGIATGMKSGVFVIDVDPRNGGAASFARLCQQIGDLPRTLSVTTGSGGSHHYLRLPSDRALRSLKLTAFPGIDFKGEGGLVVAPPSLHACGRRYEWSH